MADKYTLKSKVSTTADSVMQEGLSNAKGSLGKISSLKGLSDKAGEIQNLLSAGVVSNSSRDDLANVFNITWGAKYLFMVRLQGGINSPLDDYVLPASSVTESIPEITTLDISLPACSNFRIPDKKGIPEISVTLYDTEDCVVEKSLRAWCLEIHDGVTCNYIEDSYRDLSVYKLNFERNIVLETKYKVIPRGGVRIEGASRDSGARELSIDFLIVDYSG